MLPIKELIGMKEVDAIKTLGDLGVNIRIVSRDGTKYAAEGKFKNNRINLSIEKGRVSNAEVG